MQIQEGKVVEEIFAEVISGGKIKAGDKIRLGY